jgi:hypothetical protein
MKKIYYLLAIALGMTSLTACSDFLDQMPDERTELQTETEVVDLLKGAYPPYNYQYPCELSSDNLIDNNAPHLPSSPNDKQVENHYNYPSNARWNDEVFRFEPAASATWSEYDSPGQIWDGWFNSIASVNAALEALDKVAAKQGITDRKNYGQLSDRLRAAYGEALLLRAYDHFILANIFGQAYKDETTSAKDISIPYITEPETELIKNYTRLSVKEVYDHIIADMEEGLRYVSDSYYEAPKYHFNTQAAHALAARVYLFHHDWDKCIEHANAVLGTDDQSLLRMSMDYSIFESCASAGDYANAWQNPALNNNLLLIDTYSTYARKIFGYRYSVAGEAASQVLMVRTNSQLWSGYIVTPIAVVSGMLFSSSQHDYGFFSCKIQEQFQMDDKIAQTGYVHQIIRAFTGMNLLLERAEAYIMKNDLANASHDLLAYWNNSIETFSAKDKESYYPRYIKMLTDEILKSNFSNTETTKKPNCFDNWDFITKNISPSITISPEAVPYMNCLNDFRRFENSFEGTRFFDLKRWGMEWTHYYGLEKTAYVMAGIDARRALEAPWEALANGAGTSRPTENAQTNNNAQNELRRPADKDLRITE